MRGWRRKFCAGFVARTGDEELDGSVVVFDDGGAAFDPVAGVEILDAADRPDRGGVDVPAEDAVHVEIFRVADDRFLELPDKADDIFHLGLDVGAQRPVAEPEEPAEEIYEAVAAEKDRVADVAGMGEPPQVLDHGVELVPVDDQQAASVRRVVDRVFLQGDARVGTEKSC